MAEPLESDSGIVVKVTYPDGSSKNLAYPEKISSGELIKDSLTVSGAVFTLAEIKQYTKEYKRSKGAIKGAFKFVAGVSKEGINFEIDKKPVWEIERMTEVTYRLKDEKST